MATSSVSKRKAAQQSGKQKFDLVIGPYSFKLVHPDRGLWKATCTITRGIAGGRAFVRYPDGNIVHETSRKAMLDYLRYAYGAEKKPSTKKVTGEANAGTTLVEEKSLTDLNGDTCTPVTKLVKDHGPKIDTTRFPPTTQHNVPCPAASDTRVPGCAGYIAVEECKADLGQYKGIAADVVAEPFEYTKFPLDHGDLPEGVEPKADKVVWEPGEIIAVSCLPGETVREALERTRPELFPNVMTEMVGELIAKTCAPICEALDFTPSGPDVRDQIVSHIQDLRKQYETINAFNDQQAKTIREADAELREKDAKIRTIYGVAREACADLVIARTNLAILTGANEEQREKITQLESDLDYTIKANLRLDSLAKYSGKMVSELWNQNRQISDSLARHKYYVDHACTQNEKLWDENDDLRDEVAKARLANTCTMLAQYPLGFWGRVWKAVRNA